MFRGQKIEWLNDFRIIDQHNNVMVRSKTDLYTSEEWDRAPAGAMLQRAVWLHNPGTLHPVWETISEKYSAL